MGVTLTITQDNYTKSALEQYDSARCNRAYTPGVGQKLWLDQPKENYEALNNENR